MSLSESSPSELLHAHHLSRQIAYLNSRLQGLEATSTELSEIDSRVKAFDPRIKTFETKLGEWEARVKRIEDSAVLAESTHVILKNGIQTATSDLHKYGPQLLALVSQAGSVQTKLNEQEARLRTEFQQMMQNVQDAHINHNKECQNRMSSLESEAAAKHIEIKALSSRLTSFADRQPSQLSLAAVVIPPYKSAQSTEAGPSSTRDTSSTTQRNQNPSSDRDMLFPDTRRSQITQPTMPMTSTPHFDSYLMKAIPPSSPPIVQGVSNRHVPTSRSIRMTERARRMAATSSSSSAPRRSPRIKEKLQTKQQGFEHHRSRQQESSQNGELRPQEDDDLSSVTEIDELETSERPQIRASHYKRRNRHTSFAESHKPMQTSRQPMKNLPNPGVRGKELRHPLPVSRPKKRTFLDHNTDQDENRCDPEIIEISSGSEL
jgi:hypothetical protein